MTPTMESPVSADQGYSSISAGLESLLDAPDTSTQQAAPGPPQEPEAVADEPIDQPGGEEAPSEDEAPAPEMELDDEDADPDEEVIDVDGRKRYHVKPAKMLRLTAANKFVKEISDFAPDIQTAKAHYEAASDFRALQSDFASGDPEGVQNFMGYWANGAPAAFHSMAQQLPAFLARAASQDPGAAQALKAIESQVHRATIADAYDRAVRSGDPKDLYAAQSLDFAINGKFHESLDKIPARTQQQVQDPVRQREQQIEQREQQFAQQRWAEFDSQALSGATQNALKTAVDAAFKVAEKAFTPGLLNAAKRGAMAQAETELKKNFEWNRNQEVEMRDIQRDFLKAIRTGQKTNLEPRAAALVQAYQARLAQVLPRIVKPLIGEQTRAVVAQSQAQHTRLAQGAKKTSPGAGGAPAARSVLPAQGGWKNVSEGLDALLG